jgi:signal transduction histidine kinase
MTSPKGVQEAGAVIASETRRLIELVERVLAFGRLAPAPAGRRAAAPQRLAPLIEEAIAAFAPLAAQGDVTIETALDPDLAAPVDPAGLRQVIMNLLDNAVKFGPAAQTIRVELLQDGADARLRVDDQGPGVPAPYRGRIWRPFSRLAREVESRVAGSGLGLAVVRDVAKRHGGKASVEDAPGGGARFTVRFPGACRADREELACAS